MTNLGAGRVSWLQGDGKAMDSGPCWTSAQIHWWAFIINQYTFDFVAQNSVYTRSNYHVSNYSLILVTWIWWNAINPSLLQISGPWPPLASISLLIQHRNMGPQKHQGAFQWWGLCGMGTWEYRPHSLTSRIWRWRRSFTHVIWALLVQYTWIWLLLYELH